MSTENTITTAAADVAAAPNATLDELVGTTTNTAILPEPDAHAIGLRQCHGVALIFVLVVKQ